MAALTIRHVTTYRYRHPVAFGEHRMMLRPRDSHDQRVIEANLEIRPAPSSLRHVQDAFGNHVAIARFADVATELTFESTVSVEHSPADAAPSVPEDAVATFPVDYSTDERPDLAHCIHRDDAGPDDTVARWARQFLPATGGQIAVLELLTRLSQGIHEGFLYRRRDAKGIQAPIETLQLGHGSCRDFALLMIDAARSLGLAARFASGYLATMPDVAPTEAHGATHAWAQIYLPGTGWIDFDPNSGNVGKASLVTVAVVRDPEQATPLHGTFVGSRADTLGMEVHVSVTPHPGGTA
ncbi:transglutaminase family protein [uncultured Reyranella sp.]|uniref:transglutaminase family protein n=1 Tax=uncultured Reyranella sp. TaxID=735512 RepID=UPI00259CB560|nr:transglutaminase family protein [uncultured Reyranella sp.]